MRYLQIPTYVPLQSSSWFSTYFGCHLYSVNYLRLRLSITPSTRTFPLVMIAVDDMTIVQMNAGILVAYHVHEYFHHIQDFVSCCFSQTIIWVAKGYELRDNFVLQYRHLYLHIDMFCKFRLHDRPNNARRFYLPSNRKTYSHVYEALMFLFCSVMVNILAEQSLQIECTCHLVAFLELFCQNVSVIILFY